MTQILARAALCAAGLVLSVLSAALAAAEPPAGAADTSWPDAPPTAGAADTSSMSSPAEPAAPWPDAEAPAPATPPPRGNPLWSMPLTSLTATPARPLFTPSRRPPAVAEAPPPAAAPPPPPPPAAPARPALTLVGTIVGAAGPRDSFGLFLADGSNASLRLRTGEQHEGWELRTVGARDATLGNSRGTVVLKLPEPTAAVRPPASAPVPGHHPPGAGGGPPGLPPPRAASAQVVVPRRPPPSPLDGYTDH